MLPLHGVRIVDLTSVVAGPLATRILAEQGAEVWKIEPAEGDRARHLAAPVGFSPTFVTLNAGKRSVVLDLRAPDDTELLRQLVRISDVLVHNFRPGAMARAGLGEAALQAARPELIVARISGFGHDGPMRDGRAYDPIIQAESAMARWGVDGPALTPQWICDKTTALFAAQAVTAALVARAGSGRGTLVDISMLEAAVAFGWPDLHADQAFPDRPPSFPSTAEVYRPWQTADGWIVVVILSPAEFKAWVEALELPHLLQDPRYETTAKRLLNWSDLRRECAPLIKALTSEDALERLRRTGVPAGEVRLSSDLAEHPQLRHTQFLSEEEHPETGRVRRHRPVAAFDGARGDFGWPARGVGEDREALLQLLAASAAQAPSKETTQ